MALNPAELDVAMFATLARQGHAAARASDLTAARELLGQALGLWRGPALADAAPLCGRLAGEAARLEEQRLAVVEERAECDLALGRHAEVAGELAGLVAEFPLRERLVALLRGAAGRGADLVVFPELALTTFLPRWWYDDGATALAGVAGFVEAPRFYPYLSGRRNLSLLADYDEPVSRSRIDEVLELVELRERAKDRVGGYSHGMRQRLGIGCTPHHAAPPLCHFRHGARIATYTGPRIPQAL